MIKRSKKFTKSLIVSIGFIGIAFVIFAVILFMLQGKDIPVFSPSGLVAKKEKDLLVFTLLLSLVVIVPVYAMLVFFAFRYRQRGGKGTYTPEDEDNPWFEALWWGIPITIIAILGSVTWFTTHQLDPSRPLDSDTRAMNVQVVALQWRWLFIYPEHNIATLNELRMPVGTPVNFQLTADGPMAGFWIPSLGSQVYAMPAMSSRLSLQADKAGMFRGSNTNITGTGYSDMDFRVIAVSSKDVFDTWAGSISSNKQYKHLDWSTFEEISRQTRDKSVYYFYLHDKEIYSKIIKKFTDSKADSNSAMSNNKHEGHN